jgi:hypothetical protein
MRRGASDLKGLGICAVPVMWGDASSIKPEQVAGCFHRASSRIRYRRAYSCPMYTNLVAVRPAKIS